ncbi:phage tail sheath subtilisin-like domain-containing protein [Breoghania sp.]|uniref:phage tail sheath subtilisin-like domain-containing protein n=1 Tax=Breoghania sp. TaxID=2065378 RepID=UPI002AA89837|nr:phage tail sheath subtilisin-like domain-containing protein [Breoghania sp.]
MAGTDFLHGVEVIEVDDGTRPIQTVKSSVIGIIGTAPDADEAVFPANTPVMIAGSRSKAASLDTSADRTALGTLPNAVDLILDQIGAAIVVVRVEEGADDAETLSNVIGGTQADGSYTGVHALKAAQTEVGFTPRILIAPGFTGDRPEDPENPGTYLANSVVAELLGIAEQLRAHILADGPSTTDSAAMAYTDDWGSRRVYVIDPGVVKVMRDGVAVSEPASSAVAGLVAKTDNNKGFWRSPSNQTINGIVGTSRPIDFALGDVNSRANLLNENNVATIIRENGFRLWGNRTCSADPKFQFLSVSRTYDMICDSILRNHLWAVDRNITKTYLKDVTEGVNAYIRELQALGAVLGGTCYADPDLNTAESMAGGKVWFDVDFTPPYPAEHVIFRVAMVNDYLEDLV